MERKGLVTFKGTEMTLTGNEVKVGDKAPDFTVMDNGLSAKKLTDYDADAIVILSVPSIDTSVCDTEVRKFNEQAANLPANVKVLTISVDLPFAQARWCGAAGIDNVETLSDYKDKSFSDAFGVMIKELGLLARSIFIVDKTGVIRYIQLVKEVADEPDYDEVLAAVKSITE